MICTICSHICLRPYTYTDSMYKKSSLLLNRSFHIVYIQSKMHLFYPYNVYIERWIDAFVCFKEVFLLPFTIVYECAATVGSFLDSFCLSQQS